MQDTVYAKFSAYLQTLDQWVISSGAEVFIWPAVLVTALFLYLAGRFNTNRKIMLATQQRLQDELNHALHESESRLKLLQALQQDNHQTELQVGRLETSNEALESKSGEYRTWWEQAKNDLEASRRQFMQLNEEHAQLKTALKEKQHHFDDQIALLNDTKEQLKKDFELLANDILENKGKAFREINRESIQTLLTPIQSEMKGFREKVEHIHSEELKQRSELKAELQHLQKLNKDITDQAEQLTTALRGQKKVQGNWGELILENVLDSSGLRRDVDYKREVSIKTGNGRQRPDAIVYMPQDKHLVIDAKTSLVAYTRYVNAESDLERETALAEHTKAVSDRINELADRDYYRLPGLNSPEVVVMFIPIESAYVEALKYDDTLYQRAIERNVLVATPTTLLTSLNIVRQLWQFEDRNKHTAELANRAEKFYNKLNGFLESMQGVGMQLDKAKESYEKAVGQLYSGRGNLIKQASEFKQLGVSVQKELPREFVEKAHLELGAGVSEETGETSHLKPVGENFS